MESEVRCRPRKAGPPSRSLAKGDDYDPTRRGYCFGISKTRRRMAVAYQRRVEGMAEQPGSRRLAGEAQTGCVSCSALTPTGPRLPLRPTADRARIRATTSIVAVSEPHPHGRAARRAREGRGFADRIESRQIEFMRSARMRDPALNEISLPVDGEGDGSFKLCAHMPSRRQMHERHDHSIKRREIRRSRLSAGDGGGLRKGLEINVGHGVECRELVSIGR